MKSLYFAFAYLLLSLSVLRGEDTSTEIDGGFVLSPSLREIILKPKNIERITQIRKLETFACHSKSAAGVDEGYVIVAVDLSLEGAFRIEGAWHGRMCFARKISSVSWTGATELYLPSSFEFEAFGSMTTDEIEAFIAKYRRPIPSISKR